MTNEYHGDDTVDVGEVNEIECTALIKSKLRLMKEKDASETQLLAMKNLRLICAAWSEFRTGIPSHKGEICLRCRMKQIARQV
jgi:hypothetical protein